ncbi:MAG: hypothetical protein K6B74_07025 [Ruminococcus sp.]|nr:hypothetical protein [Ruminococcus sp.]
MKLKIMWRPRENNNNDVTPEAQKIYEEQLKERAKLGRVATVVVCALNIFVTGIVELCRMDYGLLIVMALVGIVFSVKGRGIGRIMNIIVCFFLMLIGYSVTMMFTLTGTADEGSAQAEMLFRFILIYGVLTLVYLLRSRQIGSWFEYAESYKCRYLGKKYFE